jgi:hypothetical protein
VTFRSLVGSVVGAALCAGAWAWWFSWGWGPTLAAGTYILAVSLGFEWFYRRNSSRLRQSYLLRGSEPPPENSFAFRTLALGAVTLWLVEVGSLAFVATGILILVRAPQKWPVALATIGFFGSGAGFFAYLLLVRHRMVKAGVLAPVATTQQKTSEQA